MMTICNSCRYCEGLCAVFPAMEKRLTFTTGDLTYLANLCHECGACQDACQFAAPHPFNVLVPASLSRVRSESYAKSAWPLQALYLLRRNEIAVSLIAALSIAGFFFYQTLAQRANHGFPGADVSRLFYQYIPHNVMVLVFGGASLYTILALIMSARRFWHAIGAAPEPTPGIQAIKQAMLDAARLRYLHRESGCPSLEDPGNFRRSAHHLVFYGFLLCFASTCVATIYHYLLGREAPYPWYDVPVILGGTGGLCIMTGCVLFYRIKTPSDSSDATTVSLATAFLLMLFLTAFSGTALLLLRHTAAIAIVLPLHCGLVFSFFLTMPYGKFVHGIYRWLALVRYAREATVGDASAKSSCKQ